MEGKCIVARTTNTRLQRAFPSHLLLTLKVKLDGVLSAFQVIISLTLFSGEKATAGRKGKGFFFFPPKAGNA